MKRKNKIKSPFYVCPDVQRGDGCVRWNRFPLRPDHQQQRGSLQPRDWQLPQVNRVGIKKPTQKKPTQKNPLKKNPLKMVFLGFFKFFIFYENNINFSLSNRFFMNK
jgi:hypothetical protein